MNAIDYEARKHAKAFMAAQLQKANPHLVAAGPNESTLTAAAKNIRIELKRAYPGYKFSVTSSRYSGGNSISVRWTDGPTSDQVHAITNKYKAGSFDGMTDCYNYEHCAWTDAFGEGKYISTTRSYSDKLLAGVIGRVCRYLGGVDQIPTVEDWRNGRTWNLLTSGGVDLNREINVALYKHTCAVEKVTS